jgi:hypothetical protein
VKNRSNDAGISKRLDHFLVHHRVLESLCNFHSWIETFQISNHFLNILEVSLGTTKPKVAFKHNISWVVEEDFRKLVVDSCKGYDPGMMESTIHKILNSLKLVKDCVIPWAEDRLIARDKDLNQIGQELKGWYESYSDGSFLDEVTSLSKAWSLRGKKYY